MLLFWSKDLIGKNRKENGQFPCGWNVVLLPGGWVAVVSRKELVAKKYVYGQTSDGRSSIKAT